MEGSSLNLPEEAKLLHAHAILQTGQGSLIREAGNLIVRNDEEDGTLVFVARLDSPQKLLEIISDRPGRRVLCPSEFVSQVEIALPGWTQEESLTFELQDLSRLVERDARIRKLTNEDDLSLLDSELRKAIESRISSHSIYAAFDDPHAVCFAFTHWRSARFFDLSIDTVESHRRQGLAKRVVSQLIHAELDEQRWPVWGAEVENLASIQLALSLGLQETGSLVLFSQGS